MTKPTVRKARTGIMQATPICPKRILKWQTSYIYVQPKLDGVRCLLQVNSNGNAILLSSTGEPIVSAPHIQLFAARNLPQHLVLDGELYLHGLPFESIASLALRTKNIPDNHTKLEFHVFDVKLPQNFDYRLQFLANFFSWDVLSSKVCPLKLVRTEQVPLKLGSTEEDIEDQVRPFLHRFLQLGFEGLVVRNPASVYEEKRSYNLLKLKPSKQDVYQIVDFYQERDKNGNLKNSLGGFVVCSPKNPAETFCVGSGFTKEQRETFWKNAEDLIGRAVVVNYQDLTKTRKIPRFPTFVTII